MEDFHKDMLKFWKKLLKDCQHIIRLLQKEPYSAERDRELAKWRKAQEIGKAAIRRHKETGGSGKCT